MIICDKKGRIIFLGCIFVGSVVDFTAFKQELGAWHYHGKVIHVDLGFVGIDKVLKLNEGEDRKSIIQIRENINVEVKEVTSKTDEIVMELETKNIRLNNENDNNTSTVSSNTTHSFVSKSKDNVSEKTTDSKIFINIPHKKKRVKKGQPKYVFSDIQKEENKILSSERIIVEHSIGGFKRYFILRNENRAKIRKKLEDSTELCVGLWNFRKGFKNKMPQNANQAA